MRLAGKHAYLDTNIFILAIEDGHASQPNLKELFVAIDDRAVRATTSDLTLAELISKPLAQGAQDLVDIYEAILSPDGAIETRAVERTVLRSAAALQGRLAVKLHDAIHVATALAAECDCFISNDRTLGRRLPAGLDWITSDGLAR